MSTETNATPAAELRAAASKIRETAHRATDGPWYANTDSVCTDWDPDSSVFKLAGKRDVDVTLSTAPDDAEHIALWHPGVAGLVADWLDLTANCWDLMAGMREHFAAEPLKLARAINGGAR